jgi:hypothetical protein
MTELSIDSKSPKFDRRKVLSGAAALPLVALPVIPSTGNAAEAPEFTEKQAWIAADKNNEMLDLMIEAARCSEISLDLIYNIISPLRRDIAVHVCQTIVEFEKARDVEWYIYRPTEEYLSAMDGAANKGDVFVKKPVSVSGYQAVGTVRNV